MKTFKKYLAMILACLLLVGLVACADNNTPKDSDTDAQSNEQTESESSKIDDENTEDEGNKDDEEEQSNAIKLDKSATFIKLLDERQYFTDTGVTCDWSCAGIEFSAECEGDITVTASIVSSTGCYFRAYVDGAEWMNGDTPYYECFSGYQSFVIKDIPNGVHTIRIVKATGYTLARAELVSIEFENGTTSSTAPADKDLFIEYIGDSIFCGWGLVKTPWGAYNGTYQSQDGTLAVPYLVSNKLNADYSVIAVSGQGAVYGTPNIENAYKYASYGRDSATEYSFDRKADVVVINVGTNDVANGDKVSSDEFATAYKRMLEYVRAKNGDECVIIAVYNMMNHGYGTRVEEVVKQLGGVEENYYVLRADRCSGIHNNAQHPIVAENVGYAQVIGDMISAIFNDTYQPPKDADMLIQQGENLAESDIPAILWKDKTETN